MSKINEIRVMFSSLFVFVGGKKWQNTIHSASYQLLISPHMKCKNDKLFECKLDILFGANAIQITIPCATVQQMLFGYEKERVFQARVIPNKRRKTNWKIWNFAITTMFYWNFYQSFTGSRALHTHIETEEKGKRRKFSSLM